LSVRTRRGILGCLSGFLAIRILRAQRDTAIDVMTTAADKPLHAAGLREALVPAAVHLHWLALGAGAPSGSHLVRFNGKAYEALSAAIRRRQPPHLYHAGLEVRLGDAFFVIEAAPSPDSTGARRGVVAEGSVGSRIAGVFRLFRYEVRCWSGAPSRR
jgi:hypothetical protein